MQPMRYTVYMTAAALVWNTAWVYLVYRFEHAAVRLLTGHDPGDFLVWVAGLVAALVLGRYALGWYRKRKPAGP
jgi:membrane protein DedA with SNARE-associated domain